MKAMSFGTTAGAANYCSSHERTMNRIQVFDFGHENEGELNPH